MEINPFAKSLCLGALLWAGLTIQSAVAAGPSGTWTGTFSGSEHGTVTITIDSNQAVTCDFQSATTGDHKLTGGVTSVLSSGSFIFSCSNFASNVGWAAAGSSSDGGTTISGNWSTTNPSVTGNFTATPGSGGGGGAQTGTVDGIYRITNADGTPGDYLSVHTNGNTVIATIYRSASPSHADHYALTDGGASVAALYKWGSWDLYNGTLTGSGAALTGYAQYGLCNANISIAFNSAGGTIRTVPAGPSQFAPASAQPTCNPTGAEPALTMSKTF